MFWRLFHRFKECVERFAGKIMHFVDDEDAVPAIARFVLDRFHDRFPNVVDAPYRSGELAVENAGYKVDATRGHVADLGDAGHITSQDFPAGLVAPSGTTIRLQEILPTVTSGKTTTRTTADRK